VARGLYRDTTSHRLVLVPDAPLAGKIVQRGYAQALDEFIDHRLQVASRQHAQAE
jgi:hypothetical protein